ncbi:alkaline-phosphatase-like protein [Hyaloraphidium curvatum]|nr:alkaline-phosphatase-like protein [Hyaloraphidium curvatum]
MLLPAALLLLALGTPAAAKPATEGIDQVLIIGVDGLSTSYYHSLLRRGALPNFARLRSQSAFTDNARAVMPTVSFVNWMSILSSADPSFHGVDGNDYSRATSPVISVTGPCSFFPNAFSVLRVAYPEAFLAARYSWPVIGEVLEPSKYLNVSTSEMSDEAVADNCVSDLQLMGRKKAELLAAGKGGRGRRGEGVMLHLCYFVAVDETGHVYGYSDDYEEAIMATDALIGRLLDTVESSGLASSTLIVLVSDHGREPLTGHEHGSFTMEELETPWSLAGPGIRKGRLRTPVHTFDTASTVLGALGVEPPLQWHGRMVLEAWSAYEIDDHPLVDGVGGAGEALNRAGWLYQEPMNPDLECVEDLAVRKEAFDASVMDAETSLLPNIFGGGSEKPKPSSRHREGTCKAKHHQRSYHSGHGFGEDPHSLHLTHKQFSHDHLSHAHSHQRANLTHHAHVQRTMPLLMRWFRAVRLGIAKVILRVATSAGDGKFHLFSFVLGIAAAFTTLLLLGSSVGCGVLLCRFKRRRLGSGAGETPRLGPVLVAPDAKPPMSRFLMRKSLSHATLVDFKLPLPQAQLGEPRLPIARPQSSPPRVAAPQALLMERPSSEDSDSDSGSSFTARLDHAR